MPNARIVCVILLVAGLALVARGLAPKFLASRAPASPPFRTPADNPMSAEKVRLGRFLFYDEHLSVNATVSCAHCHRQELAFSGGRARSVGATGELTTRNAMTLTNVAYNARYTWVNSQLKTLEQQARAVLSQEHPLEMGAFENASAVLQRLRQDARYGRLFAAAFPGEDNAITLDNVVKAISCFERTLISLNAPYDRYMAGDAKAMPESARRGLALFTSDRLKCAQCHSGFNFRQTVGHRTNDEQDDSVAYQNTGLYGWPLKEHTEYAQPVAIDSTDASEAAGRFKAPTLRNVAVTAPYMHDGSVATLEEVIDLYAAGGRVIASGPNAGDGRTNPYKSPLITGFAITPEEKRDLLAFLDSLTDRSFLTNPEFRNPFVSAH